MSKLRIAEAEALLMAMPSFPDGAYYLAGYAVECALKACICKRYQAHDWPERRVVNDSHTHDLKTLFRVADLDVARDNEMDVNPAFRDNWLKVLVWSEEARYIRFTATDAAKLINAVTDPANGVLPWIMNRW